MDNQFTKTTIKGDVILSDGTKAPITPFDVYAKNGVKGNQGNKGER